MFSPELLHYFSAALAIALGAIGGGIGQGIAGLGVIQSMNRQPTGQTISFRALVIGLALIESGLIMALVMSLMILFGAPEKITWPIALCELGIGIATGIAAASISIASAFVVKAASGAISRQPFFGQKIITIMLLSQSIIEAPVIFAFIIALLIKMNIHPDLTLLEGIKYLASAIAIALGSIGPSIGQGIFASSSCTAIGINKRAYNKIFPFTLLSQAVIETPMVFSLLISLMIMYASTNEMFAVLQGSTILVSAFTIGLGSIGTATGLGYTASRSCLQIAFEPGNYSIIFRTTLLVEAFIESAVIYAMIVALLLIMRVT